MALRLQGMIGRKSGIARFPANTKGAFLAFPGTGAGCSCGWAMGLSWRSTPRSSAPGMTRKPQSRFRSRGHGGRGHRGSRGRLLCCAARKQASLYPSGASCEGAIFGAWWARVQGGSAATWIPTRSAPLPSFWPGSPRSRMCSPVEGLTMAQYFDASKQAYEAAGFESNRDSRLGFSADDS